MRSRRNCPQTFSGDMMLSFQKSAGLVLLIASVFSLLPPTGAQAAVLVPSVPFATVSTAIIEAKVAIRPKFNAAAKPRPATRTRPTTPRRPGMRPGQGRLRGAFGRASKPATLGRNFGRAARPPLRASFSRAARPGLRGTFGRAASARSNLRNQFSRANSRATVRRQAGRASAPAMRSQFGSASRIRLRNPFKSAVGVPHARGAIRSFRTTKPETYYRVYSPGGANNRYGSFLVKVPPKNSMYAQKAYALPRGNKATLIQKVHVPAGTLMVRSRAAPAFRQRGGAEQFRIQTRFPKSQLNTIFGKGRPLRGGLTQTFKSNAASRNPFQRGTVWRLR